MAVELVRELEINELPAEIDRLRRMIQELEAEKKQHEERLKNWMRKNGLEKAEISGYICSIYKQVRRDLDKEELAKILDLTPYIRERVIEGFKVTKKKEK
ncbi:hypothetical protein [Carboxydothermus hydrogenoformans]|uniref:Conserved domain protein n=1 Tax=Carboxydothermus hydrogenoformans (strain ATCC BAA-161 / DSM 6008 / Z-2901) TaxID=246194 RepID=Q3ABH4_CARHZ|nr:hypothetical protein [Carboxydothermus hydrogenoformans]ABB14309.1 conserved domain protein [Carboxydothermus hydrogenoformans Z-2901]